MIDTVEHFRQYFLSDNITVDRKNNHVRLDLNLDITFQLLNDLARLFGTNEINVDHTQGGGGCETCGYGGGCDHSIDIYSVTNWQCID